MVDFNAAPNAFPLSLAPEIDALGLGDRVAELDAEGPVEAKDLIAFRFGVADGTAVPSREDPGVISIRPREGVPQDLRAARGYDIGVRVAGLLQGREREAA